VDSRRRGLNNGDNQVESDRGGEARGSKMGKVVARQVHMRRWGCVRTMDKIDSDPHGKRQVQG
jgi:hypothetical protein